MSAIIVIDVAGEAAGSPGVAREFVYTKIDPTPPLVTLSLSDDTGNTSWLWEILSQPPGASATLATPTAATTTFTPTASVPGTYLVQCTVNGGSTYGRNAVAWTTKYRAIRIPAPGETLEFGTDRGWDPALQKLIEVVDIDTSGALDPVGFIFVDTDNGSDTPGVGDGSSIKPYQTLAYAASTVAAPTTWAEFNTPCIFVVTGTHSAAITMPYRREIYIVGGPATISGTITWNYDVGYWFTESPWTYEAALMIAPRTPFGFHIHNIQGKNAADDATCGWRRLGIRDSWLHGSIVNLESGNTTNTYQTGELILLLENCESTIVGNEYIGGVRETAMPSDWNNNIVLYTNNSTIRQMIAGCVVFFKCLETIFDDSPDWERNPQTGATSYAGCIGGGSQSIGGVGCCDVTFKSGGIFGWDNSTGNPPSALLLDANTYDYLESQGATFNNMTIDYGLIDKARGIAVDESGFTKALKPAVAGDSDAVQKCLDTLDGLSGLNVLAPTGGSHTLTVADTGSLFTDEAADSGAFELEMPNAVVGLHFYILCTGVANNIIVLGSGGASFEFPNGLVESDEPEVHPNSLAHFVCDRTGVWTFASGSGRFYLQAVSSWFYADSLFVNAAATGQHTGNFTRIDGTNTIGTTARYTFAPGRNCTVVTGVYDPTVQGRYSKARIHGHRAQAVHHLNSGDGGVDVAGASQIGDAHLRLTTTNATPIELLAGDQTGDGRYLNFPASCSALLHIMVVARSLMGTVDEMVYWEIKAAVRTTSGGVPTVTLISKERLSETANGGEAGWDVNVDDETSPARLAIEVTGEAATSIGWTASVRLCEVVGGGIT